MDLTLAKGRAWNEQRTLVPQNLSLDYDLVTASFTKTTALEVAIAELKTAPREPGKQTSQYIAIGVKQFIQDDFSRLIAEAVKGPIAELSRETYHARLVMQQVGISLL